MAKILLFLLLLPSLVLADAVIFSGNDVKTLKQNIDLFGVAKIQSGALNPSISGSAAPIGSIYMSTTSGMWQKVGALDTNWTKYQLFPVNLTTDVSGILPPANGGTGLNGSAAANGSLLIGNGAGFTLNPLAGTLNQVNVVNGAGSITLSTPQDIATTSSPTFDDLTLSGDITLTDPQFNSIKVGASLARHFATGVAGGAVMSVNASPALIDIAARDLTFSAYTTTLNIATPVVKNVSCPAVVGLAITNIASTDTTYLLESDACVITQQSTFPTPQQRRTLAFLGRAVHLNHSTVSAVTALPDLVVDTNSQVYDLFDAIGAFNISGNRISPNGANLSFNRSAGITFRRSANYQTDVKNPNETSVAAAVIQSHIRLTSTTVVPGPFTVIDPANYDVAGTVTAVPGGVNTSTNQRVYLFSTGLVAVAYGQTTYTNLASAIAGIGQESFVINSQAADGGILMAIISCPRNATNMTTQCFISYPGRFDQIGVTTGSTATTTLQQAYDNSVQPQITLTSTSLGIQVRDASTPIGASLLAIQNNAGSTSYLGVDVNGITTTNFVGTGTTGAVRVHNLTTAQKNALTAAAGMMIYDTTLARFECYTTVWGPCGSGSVSSTQSPTAGSSLTLDLVSKYQTIRLTAASAISLSATLPFGSSAPVSDAEITLVNTSDTNTVTFTASDTAKGVIDYGVTLGKGGVVTLIYSLTDDRYYYKSTGH